MMGKAEQIITMELMQRDIAYTCADMEKMARKIVRGKDPLLSVGIMYNPEILQHEDAVINNEGMVHHKDGFGFQGVDIMPLAPVLWDICIALANRLSNEVVQ